MRSEFRYALRPWRFTLERLLKEQNVKNWKRFFDSWMHRVHMVARPYQSMMLGQSKHVRNSSAKPKQNSLGWILEEWKESRGDVTKTMVIEGFHGLRSLKEGKYC